MSIYPADQPSQTEKCQRGGDQWR